MTKEKEWKKQGKESKKNYENSKPFNPFSRRWIARSFNVRHEGGLNSRSWWRYDKATQFDRRENLSRGTRHGTHITPGCTRLFLHSRTFLLSASTCCLALLGNTSNLRVYYSNVSTEYCATRNRSTRFNEYDSQQGNISRLNTNIWNQFRFTSASERLLVNL
jgi:hypothetical protein